ncbi:hypothetical protein [Gordonia alkaliphila]|uniref:Tail terminator n=1 Tax=Gordonia alkaliphila TaxID=1053547 RepID=A0ABP8ZK09_9ACTN
MIVFPKPEAEIIRVVKARVPNVTAAAKAPQTMPDRFVRPVAAGGSKRSLVLSQRICQVFAYAATESAAAGLIEDTVAALVAAGYDSAEKTIRGVTVVGEPSYYPDPDTDRPRYSATVALLLRGRGA